MAYEEKIERISVDAAEDLSEKQYFFVSAGTTGASLVLSNAGGDALGVLQNDPILGQAASIGVGGVMKTTLGGTVAVGDEVAVDALGRAVAAVSTNIVLGTCLQGGAVGEIGSIHFDKNGVKA